MDTTGYILLCLSSLCISCIIAYVIAYNTQKKELLRLHIELLDHEARINKLAYETTALKHDLKNLAEQKITVKGVDVAKAFNDDDFLRANRRIG